MEVVILDFAQSVQSIMIRYYSIISSSKNNLIRMPFKDFALFFSRPNTVLLVT